MTRITVGVVGWSGVAEEKITGGDMRNQQAKVFPGESADVIGVVEGSQS